MGSVELTEIVFREARPEDQETILSISQITFEEHEARIPDEFHSGEKNQTVRLAITNHFKRKSFRSGQPGSKIIVCCEGDTVIGHAVLLFYHMEFDVDHHDYMCVVYDISFTPEHRRRGLGLKLLAHVQNIMAETGVTKATATIWSGNPASSALFDRFGYEAPYSGRTLRLSKPLEGPQPTSTKNGQLASIIVWCVTLGVFLLFGLLAFTSR